MMERKQGGERKNKSGKVRRKKIIRPTKGKS